MTKMIWSIAGGLLGLVVGGTLGAAAALGIAAALPAPNDGTFAMRQMIVGLPVGAVVGLVVGIAWALRG